ncbi:MAG TPA: TlpA disulfide reductase family protein [Gammaproteobacteria bacterium]|nr:TlpA disulfide reductase family protein [Gammaproteobacteria bacterium]
MSFNFYRRIVIIVSLSMAACTQALSADFTLPDIDGVKHTLSDYRGKWVVVNYWATWCPPCLDELPELDAFHSRHKGKDALVLGVNMEDIPLDKLREFVDEHFINYPVLLGGNREETAFGPLPGLPVTYLISPTGEVAASHLGRVEAASIEEFIRDNSPAEPARSVSRPAKRPNS